MKLCRGLHCPNKERCERYLLYLQNGSNEHVINNCVNRRLWKQMKC